MVNGTRFCGTLTANLTGTSNTMVGTNANLDAPDLTNATAIGDSAVASKSNQVVLGNSNVTETLLRGNVGIGMTAPQSSLQVNGYIQLALTSGAPPAADCDNATKYGRMKVDATGNKLYVCTSTGWKSTVLAP